MRMSWRDPSKQREQQEQEAPNPGASRTLHLLQNLTFFFNFLSFLAVSQRPSKGRKLTVLLGHIAPSINDHGLVSYIWARREIKAW